MAENSMSELEYGRMQIVKHPETGTATLIVENVHREGEHWLTLGSIEAPHDPLGYIRLRPLAGTEITTDRHLFEVAEVRPASGPILRSRAEPGEAA